MAQIGKRGTEYVRLLGFERRDISVGAEYRVTEAEDYPGHLEIGVYGYSSGQEYSTAILTRENAQKLAVLLDGGPEEGAVELYRFRHSTPDSRFQRWHEGEAHSAQLAVRATPDELKKAAARVDVVVSGELFDRVVLGQRGRRVLRAAIQSFLTGDISA